MNKDLSVFKDYEVPRRHQLSAQFRRSDAYYTLKDYLPMVITNIMDTLSKEKEELEKKYKGVVRNEIKRDIAKLAKLKYELQTNKKFLPFEEEQGPDVRMWNRYIESLPDHKKHFFFGNLLDVESYLYRKFYSIFQNTLYLKNYDYFAKQKYENSSNSCPFMTYILKNAPYPKELPVLHWMFKLTMWYRKIESALNMKKPEEITDEMIDDVINSVADRDQYILCNDMKSVWDCILAPSKEGKTSILMHIILNDCGFELFGIFLIASFLIEHELATEIMFHPKAYQYYVTDATFKDVDWFLGSLSRSENPILKTFGEQWLSYFGEGKFKITKNEYFWTTPIPFYKMKEVDPKLYQILKEGDLIIFCGDLNYRKLVGDLNWDESEEFITCLRGFVPTNIVAIRAITSSVICNIDKDPAIIRYKIEPNWFRSGDYGLIQFCQFIKCPCEQAQDYLPSDDYFQLTSSSSESCNEKLEKYLLKTEQVEQQDIEELGMEEGTSSTETYKPRGVKFYKKKPRKFVWKCQKLSLSSIFFDSRCKSK